MAFVVGDRITLQCGEEFFEVRDVDDVSLFWTARRVAVGVLSTTDAAQLVGLQPDALEAGFSALRDCGLAYDPSAVRPSDDVASEAALDVVGRFGEMWRGHLFRDPVFAPSAPAPLVWAGFLIESWHRSKALSGILARARRHLTADPVVVRLFERLSDEEDDHSHYYAQALGAFGIDAERLLSNSAPLLSTRALTWFLTELAELRPLSFLGTCRITEAEAGDERLFTSEAERLSNAYGVPKVAVRPILEHGMLDAGASHKLLIDEALASRSAWPRAAIESLLQDMHDFRHAYGGFLSGVRDHYGGDSDSIPNRVFRWEDFCR